MKLEFAYLAFAIVFSLADYFINKKLIFDKHVHSKTLIRAMTANLVFNILVTLVYALTLFSTGGSVFEFLLRTKEITRGALIILGFALYIIEVTTVIIGARISLKRKGHKNLKLERILTSDFAVCAACGGISTLGLGLIFFI